MQIFCYAWLSLSQCGKNTPNCDIQGIQFVHFPYFPSPFLPMPPHERPLMALSTQGDYGVMLVLLDVVGI